MKQKTGKTLNDGIFYYCFFNLDFTLARYEKLCLAIIDNGYTSQTVNSYINGTETTNRFVVLRHDVDRDLRQALRIAKLEHQMGIKSTYYFRISKTLQTDIIKNIANMGHEVGYHYETLDKAKGDYEKAAYIFAEELKKLRETAKVTTASMHGNPLTKWDNRDLWKKYKLEDFDLNGEAYLSFDFGKVAYYSDTGRTWKDGRFNIKDFIPINMKTLEKPVISTTSDLIKLIQQGNLNIYLLVHPERWRSSFLGWFIRWIIDAIINLGKVVYKVFILRKK